MSLVDAAIAAACISCSCLLYFTRPNTTQNRTSAISTGAYILRNQVTHSRLLPVEAHHVFTYPTLSYLLSLNALERGALDLAKGWIFGYGGTFGRLTGLRSEPYVTHQAGRSMPGRTIKEKLGEVLSLHTALVQEPSFEDAWMMTMPALLGYEGINPLTVYFLYKPGGRFWCVILEIHNTFGESHIHICEVGHNQDEVPFPGYDYQWTFLREFHVSPFNDRSGFYTISVQAPTHPPVSHGSSSPTKGHHDCVPPSPCPSIRVHVYESDVTLSPARPGALKLSAILRVKSSTPLSTSTLLWHLVQTPFVLFLSMPRILFQAWKLHYRKGLDVHVRPDPRPSVPEWAGDFGNLAGVVDVGLRRADGVGTKWQSETVLERFARERVEVFLHHRVKETGIEVVLVCGDPSTPNKIFTPGDSEAHKDRKEEEKTKLQILYLSPRFFSILFTSPSAAHALLVGSKAHQFFLPSSEELFLEVFSPPLHHNNESTSISFPASLSYAQTIRTRPLPPSLLPPHLAVAPNHPLDGSALYSAGVFVTLSRWLDMLEEKVYWMFGARVVEGEEPWKMWERAARMFEGGVQDQLSEDARPTI